MPRRLTKTQKLLGLIEGVVLETGAWMYPYKGIGRGMIKHRGALSKAIYDLKSQGYLEEVESKAKKAYRLTPRGKLKIWQPKIEKEWDGSWRILMFDISNDSRRNKFRTYIQELGFKIVQKSVWACPYDVSTEVEKLIDWFDLEESVDYLITRSVTKDSRLRSLFDL
jgi:DNA-binding transcriptional regulator PaaX